MKLSFWGAAQQVTGSMYLLELEDGYRVLIDCGADMERPKAKDDEQKAPEPKSTTGFFPFEVSSINVVLLTHAHIDHSGNLPMLYREGYEGQILGTESTGALTALLLKDSAMLNQKKLNALGSGKRRKNLKRQDEKLRNVSRDLFFERQVHETMENYVPLAFNRKFKISDSASITFIPAGHLLGAAHIVMEVFENGIKKSICFSGDIGRKNYPLLTDPMPVPQVDYLICESTYGHRFHTDKQTPEAALADVIQRTCIDIPGRLIIPTFSVGRTQALLYSLNKLYNDFNFEPIKVFSDSALGMESTKVYQKHVRMLNQEAREFNEDNESLFDFQNLQYIESEQGSRMISTHSEPCIIISSSGMIQGGRVEQHVAANISNPYATILIIGYCAEGTLGWRLMNGQKTLRIGKTEEQVLCNVERIDVFSGHADQTGLLDFVKQQDPAKLKQIFLIHGELAGMNTFKTLLETHDYQNIEMPAKGQVYDL